MHPRQVRPESIGTPKSHPLLRHWLLLGGLVSISSSVWLSAAPAPATFPDDTRAVVKGLQEMALKGSGAWELMRDLVYTAGPRPAGSAGDKAAVAWALKTMPTLGLARVRAEPVTVPHWVRGAEAGTIVSPGRFSVALAALGGSIGTPEEGVEAEVIGFPSLAALEAASSAQVAGKIAFVYTHMERTQDGAGYGAAVPMRGGGALVAGEKGAVGLLIRSVGTDQNRLPHTGAMRLDKGSPKIPAAALSIPDADLLERLLSQGAPVRFRLQLSARSLPDEPSANVIGEVVGREKPEEIVLMGAHLDSWDLGLGALDDGAGCSIVLEAARLIAALPRPPRRTIRVVLFANEEFGLSGARAYAEAHRAELPNHFAATESDLGDGKVYRLDTRVSDGDVPAMAGLFPLLKPLGVAAGPNTAGGGADVSPLKTAGVPIFGLAQNASTYFDFHHTANDTPDKASPANLDFNVAAYASVVYALADMPGTLTRPVVEKPEAPKQAPK